MGKKYVDTEFRIPSQRRHKTQDKLTAKRNFKFGANMFHSQSSNLTCSSSEGSLLPAPPEALEAAAPPPAAPAEWPLGPPLVSRFSARQIGVRRRYVFPFALWMENIL